MENNRNTFLRQALVADFSQTEGHPQYQHWLDYALSTNERGKGLVTTIKYFISSLAEKRHLDIGCGYGGTCVAFSSEGADSVGIDYDDRLLRFSAENARDHPLLKLDFKKIDVMNWAQASSLGKFDVITCDNVIEHVADPGRLVAMCRYLLNPDGLIYITAPNAFSIGQIRKDCHYGLFGISLLDPDDGAFFVKATINQPSYDVSWYYRYGVFESVFSRFDLSLKLLNPYQVSDQDIDDLYATAQQLLNEAKSLAETGAIPQELYAKVVFRLKHHIQMIETDILFCKEISDPLKRAIYRNQIFRDYDTELWYFVLRPKGERSEDATPLANTQTGFSSQIDVNALSGRAMLRLLGKKISRRIWGNSAGGSGS